jgi:hypothetical protein
MRLSDFKYTNIQLTQTEISRDYVNLFTQTNTNGTNDWRRTAADDIRLLACTFQYTIIRTNRLNVTYEKNSCQ